MPFQRVADRAVLPAVSYTHLTAMVMLFGGCGKKNTVVTGRYYYPDQEKDAKTEETADDADESAETKMCIRDSHKIKPKV